MNPKIFLCFCIDLFCANKLTLLCVEWTPSFKWQVLWWLRTESHRIFCTEYQPNILFWVQNNSILLIFLSNNSLLLVHNKYLLKIFQKNQIIIQKFYGLLGLSQTKTKMDLALSLINTSQRNALHIKYLFYLIFCLIFYLFSIIFSDMLWFIQYRCLSGRSHSSV